MRVLTGPGVRITRQTLRHPPNPKINPLQALGLPTAQTLQLMSCGQLRSGTNHCITPGATHQRAV